MPEDIPEVTDETLRNMSKLLDMINQSNSSWKSAVKYQTDFNKLKKEELGRLKEIAVLDAQHLETEMNLLMSQGKRRDAAKKLVELEKHLATSISLREGSLAKSDELEAAIMKKREEMNELDEESLELAEKELKILEDSKEESDQITKNLDTQIDHMKEKVDVMDKEIGKLKKVSESYDKLKDTSKKATLDIGQKMFGLVDVTNTWVGGWQNAVRGMTGAGDGVGAIGAGIKEALSPTNLATSAITKYTESIGLMIGKLDGAATSFAAATGTGNEFRGSLEDIYQAGNTMGLTMGNASKGLQGLWENQIGFTNMTKSAQNALAGQAGMLETLGVSAKDTAEMMNTFSKTMGTTATQSLKLTKQLAMMGTTLGITASKMIKDFQQANKTLAVYGTGSVKMFTNLAAAAKAAGVEMGALLGIASKFDTFESAATAVGQLNAVLGANLSATEMLMMTEDQRIETVIQQMQINGDSFAQMDRFKQKALANIVGITDMAEANRIFGMSMSEYRNYNNQMTQAEMTQSKFEDAIKATLPLKEKFFALITEFAPRVEPLLATIHNVLDKILTAWEALNGWGGGLFSTWVAGAAMTFVTLQAVQGILLPIRAVSAALLAIKQLTFFTALKQKILTGSTIPIKQAEAIVTGEQAVAEKVLNKMKREGIVTTTASGRAAYGAAAGVAALGIAVLGIGVGLGFAAEGLGKMVAGFKGLGDAAWPATVAILGFSLIFLGFVLLLAKLTATGILPIAAGGLLAVGAAALLLGTSIMLAAEGMAKFVSSFRDLNPDNIERTAIALGSLAATFAGIGMGGFMVATGITVIGIMADDIERLNDSIDATLVSTLENLVALSATQTLNTINETSADIRVDEMITLKTTLTQNLKLDLRIGDKKFMEHVKDAIQHEDFGWDSKTMGVVNSKIYADGKKVIA